MNLVDIPLSQWKLQRVFSSEDTEFVAWTHVDEKTVVMMFFDNEDDLVNCNANAVMQVTRHPTNAGRFDEIVVLDRKLEVAFHFDAFVPNEQLVDDFSDFTFESSSDDVPF